MSVIDNMNPLGLVIYLIVSIVTSLLAPIAIEWYKDKRNNVEHLTEFEKTEQEREHDSEIHAIRLEFELAAVHEKINRLVIKVRRVITFVRAKDPAIDYIMADLEAEIEHLGFDSKSSIIKKDDNRPLTTPP